MQTDPTPSTNYPELDTSGAYGPERVDLCRRAAGLVDRILPGADAADLACEQATKFEMILNLQTAKALSVTIPQSVLLRAKRVSD